MYKKKLDPPELKSIYDDDNLEKSVLNNKKEKIDVELGDEQEPIGGEGTRAGTEPGVGDRNEEVVGAGVEPSVGDRGEEVVGVGVEGVQEPSVGERGEEVVGVEGVQEPSVGDMGDSSSSSSNKSITFNRIKKKVVRKYMLIKNKIKTSSIDYKLDLINDAINKINSRINLLEIKVNNLELDVNKNKNELLEHDRLTSIEMTNIHDKLNNANIIILD